MLISALGTLGHEADRVTHVIADVVLDDARSLVLAALLVLLEARRVKVGFRELAHVLRLDFVRVEDVAAHPPVSFYALDALRVEAKPSVNIEVSSSGCETSSSHHVLLQVDAG